MFEKLEELDHWITEEINKLPHSARKIITAHDAFGYFGERYGVRVLSPVGISTNEEPSARAIIELIEEIKLKDKKKNKKQ